MIEGSERELHHEGTDKQSNVAVPYLLIAKETQLAFKVANALDSMNSKVIACEPDVDDLSQLWFASTEKLGEITNAATGLVMEVEDGVIYLRRGRLKQSQLFFLNKQRNLREPEQLIYTIKPSKSSTQALCLCGALMAREFVSNSQKFIFELKLGDKSLPIVQSCVLRNHHSNLVIDVPDSTFQQGKVLIQYTLHGMLNQRWAFIRQGQQNKYKIKNLMNTLALDIHFNGKTYQNKVIQKAECKEGSQLWRVERQHGGFLIQSLKMEGLFLGVENQSRSESAHIELVSRVDPSAIWKLIGFEPPGS